MMDYLYHGSITPGITRLEARSQLHASDKQVVYLTDSIPYALFYIWDSSRNGNSSKYVTGGFRAGQAFYEEHFPDQLPSFYQGISGYLYLIPKTESARPVANRDGLYYQEGDIPVADVVYIPDVYAELLKYEAADELLVLHYNEQTSERQNELVRMIAAAIRQNGFFANNPEQQQFMQKYFSASWRFANEQTD